jgi:hypothetical protein
MPLRMARKPSAKPARKPAGPATVDVLNVHNPGKTYKRNAVKYLAARKAFLALLPKAGPGLTQTEMMAAMKKTLPVSQFGTASGWWMKTVQLDAEARGEVIRDSGKPLRWRKLK